MIMRFPRVAGRSAVRARQPKSMQPKSMRPLSMRLGPWRARARLRMLAAVSVACGLQAGCMLGPDFKEPQAPGVSGYLPGKEAKSKVSAPGVPSQTLVNGRDVPGEWWALFGSRYLDGLIQKGITNNADLGAAEAAVRVAQDNALAQRGMLFPTLTGDYNQTTQKFPTQSQSTNAASGSAYLTTNTLQLSVSYVVDVFGGIRRGIESTDALAEASGFQREAVFLTLSANIAIAAITEASIRGQMEAVKKLITYQTGIYNILKTSEEQGQIALTDVLVQETALAQTTLLLPPLEKQLAQQRHLLAQLTGGFPSEAMAATFRLKSFKLPRKLPVSLTSDLIRQRPDIRQAEANVHSASALVGVALVNRLPQIAITGDAGSQAASSLGKLFTTGTSFWMLSNTVTQTLFDGFQLYYKQKAAEETLAQAMEQYRSAVIVAFQNVADALSAVAADTKALSAAKEAELAAERNISLIQAQLQQGQISLPILLTAQQAYLNTLLARVQAEAARLSDTVALYQALGGGWWNREPPPAVVAQAETARHE